MVETFGFFTHVREGIKVSGESVCDAFPADFWNPMPACNMMHCSFHAMSDSVPHLPQFPKNHFPWSLATATILLNHFLPHCIMADLKADDTVAEVDTTKNSPIKKRNDKGVSLAVFAKQVTRDDGTEFTRFSTVLEGRYEKDGVWHSTSTFSEQQLAVLEDFAREARQFIRDEKARQKVTQ